MNIICFGKNGQVASALREVYPEASFISSLECDFNLPLKLEEFLNTQAKPDTIINATAYTKVDLAEEERESAININCHSVKVLADYCLKNNIPLVHISTDYVFNGNGNNEYPEISASNDEVFTPCNFYGLSKLEGERAILNSKCQHYIIRTSWVYNEKGVNFVKTIIKLLSQKEEINVIIDQIGSPTYALDIANAIKHILDKKLPFGTYHFTNNGFISWFEFALKIKELLLKNNPALRLASVNPILSSEYVTKAMRPLNSRLEKKKLENILIPFETSLEKCIKNLSL
jgi:dTDP-4-dehydrorhamnose reductase